MCSLGMGNLGKPKLTNTRNEEQAMYGVHLDKCKQEKAKKPTRSLRERNVWLYSSWGEGGGGVTLNLWQPSLEDPFWPLAPYGDHCVCKHPYSTDSLWLQRKTFQQAVLTEHEAAIYRLVNFASFFSTKTCNVLHIKLKTQTPWV